MNKILSFLAIFSACFIFACQYSTPELNEWHVNTNTSSSEPPLFTSFICGINFYENIWEDLVESTDVNGNIIEIPNDDSNTKTNFSSGLPISIWFSIHTKNEHSYQYRDWSSADLDTIKLYYKVIPSGKSYNDASCKWRLASSIDGTVVYSALTIPGERLFGTNCLTKEMIIANGDTISSGDEIYFLFYFLDEDSSENFVELTLNQCNPKLDLTTEGKISDTVSADGYSILRAYTLRVIYDGSTVYGR